MIGLQNIINSGKSAKILLDSLEEIDKKEHPLEILFVLHSMAESMLRFILGNENGIGKNIYIYQKNYKSMIYSDKIRKAIKIRNQTSHEALIHHPKKSDFAIDTYIDYINILAQERGIDLNSFIPFKAKKSTEVEEQSFYQKWKKYLIPLLILILSVYFIYPQKDRYFLTGFKDGTYYTFVQELIQKIDFGDIKVKTSKGSIENIETIGDSDKEMFAILQKDVLLDVYQEAQSGDNSKKRLIENITVLFPLYSGEINVLVKEDSNITSINDIEDKNIGIGKKGSGASFTAKSLYLELFHKRLKGNYFTFPEAVKALKENRIDVIIITGGEPLPKLKDEKLKGFKLLPYINTQKIKLQNYSLCDIKRESYPYLLKEDISTLCVDSFLITNITNSQYTTDFVTKLKKYKSYLGALDKNNKEFKTLHPKWRDFANRKTCLPPLPQGLLYHSSLRWDDKCKKNNSI